MPLKSDIKIENDLLISILISVEIFTWCLILEILIIGGVPYIFLVFIIRPLIIDHDQLYIWLTLRKGWRYMEHKKWTYNLVEIGFPVNLMACTLYCTCIIFKILIESLLPLKVIFIRISCFVQLYYVSWL